MPIQSFRDLIAWQEAHKLALLVYKNTETFPHKETFGITNQMRRASVSIPSNIAEGFGRSTIKDKNQFYSIAHGSLMELESQVLIARDVRYLSEPKTSEIISQIQSVGRILVALKKSCANKMN